MLSYYAAGDPDAPMVALVHGVCDSGVAWVDLINRLADRYLVIAFDSLGHGTSRRLTDEELRQPGEASAHQLERAIEHLRTLYGKTPIVIAHSMGAAISSYLSVSRPDLIRGLFLEDPAWLNEEQAAGYVERAPEQVATSAHLWRRDAAGTVAGNVDQRPGWDAASHYGWAFGKALVDPRLLATGIVSFSPPWRDIARAITVPTLVVTSDTQEVLVGTQGVAAIAKLGNPHIETAVIAGTDHGVRLSKPEEYQRVLEEWLMQFDARLRG
ncbi:alpha/beta fold hydrolase [Trueperella abortisuis]|uniref:alpha/beta fold hydrolase n=1 Tax=Trueperella abortisuis TaxID=445930 RepID=UPI00289381FF|nr:alpha/beta hydrolase [Trueperella abortisuis]